MARVPTTGLTVGINNPGPAYQSAAGASLAAFGARSAAGIDTLAKGAANLGNVLSEQALYQQDQDNVRQAKQLDTNYAADLRTLLYGDGTEANPGFYAMQGQNALDAAGGVQKQIADLRAKYLEQASNSRVAEKFDLASQERANVEIGTIDRHVSQQRLQANVDTSNARIQEAENGLITGGADPKIWDQNKAVIAAEVKAQAGWAGSSPEVAKAQFDAKFSESAAKSIATMALSDPQGAAKMLATHLPEMSGIAVQQAEQAIKTAENQQRALAEHQMVMARQAREDQANEQMSKYVQQFILQNGNVDLHQVATDPAFSHDAGKMATLFNMVTEKAKQNVQQTSQAEYSKLISDLLQNSNDPIVKAAANDPAFNTDGSKKVDLYNFAKSVSALGNTEAEQQAKAAADEWIAKKQSGEPVTLKDISQDHRLDGFPDLRKSTGDYIVKPNISLKATSDMNEAELTRRINLEPGDPNRINSVDDIYQQYYSRNINDAALGKLLTRFNNVQTPEGASLAKVQQRFVDGMKGQITRSDLAGNITVGGERYANFQSYVDSKVQELRSAGKDPSVLFQPNNPEYLGSADKMAPFLPSIQDKINGIQSELNRTNGGSPTTPQPAAPAAPSPPVKTYKAGDIAPGKDGKLHRFKGGDQFDKSNWEDVK